MSLLLVFLISRQSLQFRFFADTSLQTFFYVFGGSVPFDFGFFQDGWSPIHAAVDSGNVESLKLLMYYGELNDGNCLMDAEPNLDYFDLEKREDDYSSRVKPVVSADLINHADKEGWTAAHIAASKGFKVSLCDQVTVT